MLGGCICKGLGGQGVSLCSVKEGGGGVGTPPMHSSHGQQQQQQVGMLVVRVPGVGTYAQWRIAVASTACERHSPC